MKCSSAGVTALGGFICILTAACNEVTLLKCSCDPEGLQSLLQNDVRLLEYQKITGRVEPGTEASTTTAQQMPCLVAHSIIRASRAAVHFVDHNSWVNRGQLPSPCLTPQSRSQAPQLWVLPALSNTATRNTKHSLNRNRVRC